LFENHRCVVNQAADAGPGPDAAVSAECEAYCDFVNVCLAENEFAQSAIPSVITGLRADAPAACASACAAVGGDGVLASCIADGRDDAACVGDDSQDGLRGAIMLLAQCSRAHSEDPLRPVICVGLLESTLVANQIDFCN
jgi:hypothetical protein